MSEYNTWTSKDVRRGEIFWVEDRKWNAASGSIQRANRPAIIVSNDKANVYSPVVEVVYLTTQPKNDLPTHATIRSAEQKSIALCEQITSVNKDRIGTYIATCTDEEMQMVDQCMLINLALDYPAAGASKTGQEAPDRNTRKQDQDGYEVACLEEIANLKEDNAKMQEEMGWHIEEARQAERREREANAKLVMMQEALDEARVEASKARGREELLKEMYNDLLKQTIK